MKPSNGSPETMGEALGVWENEGGSPERSKSEHQYGRRIESDRSWTVYHVYTGVPARGGDGSLTGLSRSDATRAMLHLNRRSIERRGERIKLAALEGTDAGRRR